jgi:hypothetical protein
MSGMATPQVPESNHAVKRSDLLTVTVFLLGVGMTFLFRAARHPPASPRMTMLSLNDRTPLKAAPAATLDHSQPEVILTAATLQQETRHIGFRKELIAATAAIVLLAIFSLGRISALRKSVVDPGQLGLSAELHDLIVEVKWNAANPAVRDSERGALEIVKGGDVNRIELNQAQLRTGHFYMYTPAQTDLICFFSVYRNQNVFIGATQKVHLNLPSTSDLRPSGALSITRARLAETVRISP